MTKENNINPRSQSRMTSFPEPESIREQAEQKARAIALPDLDTLTHEEIRQMIHETQVKQIEADLQIEHLLSGLEEKDDQALIFSEERLDLAMMVKNEGIWDWNLISDETIFDERYYTMAGYAPKAFPQNFTAWKERVHPDDLPNAEAAIKHYLSGQSDRFDTEFRFRHKDGSWIWIRGQGKIVKWAKNGTPLRMIGTHTDITKRKNAEESLRRSENYYRAIFETSGTAIFILEEDTTISLVNMYTEELIGYSRQEIEGKKSWTEFVHPDDVGWMKENHYLRRQNPNAAPRQYEYRLITRYGEMRNILLGVDIIPETNQSIASCIDITDRKQAEEALAGQLRFEQAAAAASTCLLSSEISEASVTDALSLLLEASGVSRVYIFENFNDPGDGLCMRQIFEFCAPGVPPEIDNPLLKHLPYSQGFERWHEILSQGNAIQGDVRDFPYSEREILESHEIISILALPIVVEGQWWGFIGFDETRQPRSWVDMELALLRTVAEMLGGYFARKQSEEALAASERRFREILQNVATVAVQGYGMDGTVRYWNRASETFYGYTAEEALGRNLLDLIIPPEIRDEMKDKILHMADTGETMPASELLLMRKDGSHISVYSSHALVQVPGQDTELFCIDIDLTDHLRAEEEKEKLQAQLSQAQKMESIGRLAGGVAHDFNNKLAIINGYAEMSADMTDPSDPLREAIREIHAAGKQSADIVGKLLAFARQQTINPVLLDLNDTISSMLKMLQRLIGENIDLAWHPGKNLWPVKVDPSQVDQIMANLSVNSRDAISDVGKLTIETKNTIVDAEYCKTNAEAIPGRYVMLAVSDDGCGMDKEVKDRLFEPFFTTKEIGKGTGLGLPTIYGIAKQNNGFINVYSEPGEGTTFKIYFPCPETEKPSVHAAKESTGLMPTGTETILLVEDEPAILKMGREMIERLGYTVLTAENPNDALLVVSEYDGKIDLLITDVVMPEINGRDLSAQLVKNHPDLKTLYMSGYTADVIAHHGVLDENVQFIQKPFSMKDLAVKVREVIEQGQIFGEA